VQDGTLAADAEKAKALWLLREGISEALSTTGLPHKNDIALPISKLSAFCGEFEALLAAHYPDWELCLFGHIGDGNLHVNIMKPDALTKAEFLARTHEVDRQTFALVQTHAGSVSAEHGIGLLKRPWLGYTRSAAEIGLMRQLKAAFDPHNVLNPGKILE
jgi:FAD/FMN-containing dehydrogenase